MFIDNASLTLTQVPAPGALALLGLAAAGRRRRKSFLACTNRKPEPLGSGFLLSVPYCQFLPFMSQN